MNPHFLQPSDLDNARATVDRFVRRFDDSYRLLAAYAALPLVLTPELLNYLRIQFLRGRVPWVAEADLLLSELCREVGYEQFAISSHIRAYLLDEMERSAGRAAMGEVARLLIQYIGHLSRTSAFKRDHDLQAQQWAAMVYLDEHREQAAREIVEAFEGATVLQATEATISSSIERLSNLVRELTSELRIYPDLVAYAQDIGRILADPYEANLEVDRSTRIVLGRELMAPETLAEKIRYQRQSPSALSTDRHFIASLEMPGGTMSPSSDFYVEREADRKLQRQLARERGTTTTIRAPRLSGKSSLLIRGINQAQMQGSTPVYIDLQSVDSLLLENLNGFLRYFATTIVRTLGLDSGQVDRIWAERKAPGDQLRDLIEEYVLPQNSNKIILVIDEADLLLSTDYHNTFFGLLRSWHNMRALNVMWEKLDILIVISIEPHLLIADLNQSPFNVGTRIYLEDFELAQVAELNARYRSPVEAKNLPVLMDLLGGHPYLTSLAFYTMLTENMTWDQLVRTAASDRGPFSDHLQYYSQLLRNKPELSAAVREISTRGSCSDERTFYRLLQAGLMKGDDNRSCTFRCKLYEEYFKKRV